MASNSAPTASEYVTHHLTNLNQTGHAQENIIDWGLFNLDSAFWSFGLGILTVLILWRAASRATSGVPGRFQAFVEVLVEMVDDQAKNLIHSEASRKFVAPLALTVGIWIFLLNFMDLLPVDLIPMLWAGGLTVLLLCIFYNIKIKGAGGWLHELFTAPFGNHFILWPINFLMQMIEFLAKTVSHGLRLFGNMFAGELLFVLIALLGGTATVFGFAGHIIAGTAWALFHILIITLQAFIFMMLTLVYVGQAHEHH